MMATKLLTSDHDLPQWAKDMTNAYTDKKGFVHGFVQEEDILKKVLEMHGRVSLVNYIHR